MTLHCGLCGGVAIEIDAKCYLSNIDGVNGRCANCNESGRVMDLGYHGVFWFTHEDIQGMVNHIDMKSFIKRTSTRKHKDKP